MPTDPILTRPVRAKPPAPRLLLSLRDAATALALSQRMLWRLTAPRGPIPALRLGGRGATARALRYYVGDLIDWIERQTRDGQAAQGGRPPA